jgi:hypothetical protein
MSIQVPLTGTISRGLIFGCGIKKISAKPTLAPNFKSEKGKIIPRLGFRLSLGKLMERMLGSHVLSLQLARVCIGN